MTKYSSDKNPKEKWQELSANLSDEEREIVTDLARRSHLSGFKDGSSSTYMFVSGEDLDAVLERSWESTKAAIHDEI